MLPASSPSPKLVGIARLAASSELLDAKRRVHYRLLPVRSYITRCSSDRVPFHYTINPYRGCEFGCKYCYARYTHEFMELRDGLDFETKIFAKQWNPQAFRRELNRIPREEWIAIGTATDPYQPAERRYRNTRKMLEVLAGEGGRKLSVTTKSDLVASDRELLSAIARRNSLHVAISITTLDERLARGMEPYAPRPSLRLEAVRRLTESGIHVGVLACPILPGINDSEESLGAVTRSAAAAGARYLGGSLVFLRPCTHSVFYPFLEEYFPHLVAKYRRAFGPAGSLSASYPRLISDRIDRLRRKYGLGDRLPHYNPPDWTGEPQLELPFPRAV